MVLAESIGPSGYNIVSARYFPSLAILDTQEILERVGSTWQRPKPLDRLFVQDMDTILIDWVYFFDKVEQGRQIGETARTKGIIAGDSQNFEAYLLFHNALGDADESDRLIQPMRNAFVALLSQDAQQKVAVGKINKKVNEKLRQKINQLVESLGHQADAHYHRLFRELAEFDDD